MRSRRMLATADMRCGALPDRAPKMPPDLDVPPKTHGLLGHIKARRATNGRIGSWAECGHCAPEGYGASLRRICRTDRPKHRCRHRTLDPIIVAERPPGLRGEELFVGAPPDPDGRQERKNKSLNVN